MTPDTEEPPGNRKPANESGKETKEGNGKAKIVSWLKDLGKPKSSSDSLRNALEEYIDELNTDESVESIASHERMIFSNVLKLRDMTVTDVMIPRADIVAIDISASQEELMALLAEHQYSRIPVYRDALDDVVGTIHIKDIVAYLVSKKEIAIRDLVRSAPIVSPAMPVLDLLLQFRQSKKHLALVVDEYGGIDGLVTIGDVAEAIVGEIEDEFDQDDQPQIVEKQDGSLMADARVYIDEFEGRYGQLLSEEEREDIDTLGGLVFAIAGRVPARGEMLKHNNSGMVFEIIDADPRRVNRVRIKNIPLSQTHS